MDEIIIEKIKLSGKHGCFAAERDESRDFEVSMRLFLNLGPAAKTDDLSMTIDYPAAMAIAEGVLSGESVRLIEKLADTIAERLFTRFEKISVKIRRKREDYIK